MCALFSPVHPNFGWTVEEKVRDSDRSFDFAVSHPRNNNLDVSISFEADQSDPDMSKRLNHNASERDRRKKINSMYSSLRSVLPDNDGSKKLTIPATISLALKYIPELREEVKRMVQRKEELLLRALRRRRNNQTRRADPFTPTQTITATWLSDTEVMVQITTSRAQKSGISDVLGWLENDGLSLVHASSSESQGRVFYNLHFQVDRACNLDSEVLSDKLLSLYEKSRESFV